MENETRHLDEGTRSPPPETEDEAQAPPAAAETSHVNAAENETDLPNGDDHVTDAPPYWITRPGGHARNSSYLSIGHTRPTPILLEDHSEDHHVQAQSCWARSATIDEYVLVTGPTGVGAYVVWHCSVQTLKGGDLAIRKRYSEFDQLRADLVRSFPHAEAMIPQLPRKSVVSRFRPKFLEQRKNGLSHFLNCILLNPEFAASPMLKDFIFS